MSTGYEQAMRERKVRNLCRVIDQSARKAKKSAHQIVAALRAWTDDDWQRATDAANALGTSNHKAPSGETRGLVIAEYEARAETSRAHEAAIFDALVNGQRSAARLSRAADVYVRSGR